VAKLSSSSPLQRLVEISDSGLGSPAVDLAQLSDRSYRSRQSVAPASSEGGKSLGPAIVKRIAELYDGRVSVMSKPVLDTTVTLSLPSG